MAPLLISQEYEDAIVQILSEGRIISTGFVIHCTNEHVYVVTHQSVVNDWNNRKPQVGIHKASSFILEGINAFNLVILTIARTEHVCDKCLPVSLSHDHTAYRVYGYVERAGGVVMGSFRVSLVEPRRILRPDGKAALQWRLKVEDQEYASEICSTLNGAPILLGENVVGVVQYTNGDLFGVSIAALPMVWKDLPDILLTRLQGDSTQLFSASVMRVKPKLLVTPLTRELRKYKEDIHTEISNAGYEIIEPERMSEDKWRDIPSYADGLLCIQGVHYGSLMEQDKRRSRTHYLFNQMRPYTPEKPLLIFKMSDKYPIIKGDIDWDMVVRSQVDLKSFISEELDSYDPREFDSIDDLRHKLLGQLNRLRARQPFAVVETTTSSNYHIAQPQRPTCIKLLGRRADLDRLDLWARSPDPVLIVKSDGGVGKTALAATWLHERATQQFSKASTIWWSFEENHSDALSFATQTLTALSGAESHVGPAQIFAALQSQLEHQAPFLMILDGLERLLDYQTPQNFAQTELDNTPLPFQDTQVARLLGKITTLPGVKLLLTTRRWPLNLDSAERVQRYTLSALTPATARELYYELGGQSEHPQLDKLLTALNYNPKAIMVYVGQEKAEGQR